MAASYREGELLNREKKGHTGIGMEAENKGERRMRKEVEKEKVINLGAGLE